MYAFDIDSWRFDEEFFRYSMFKCCIWWWVLYFSLNQLIEFDVWKFIWIQSFFSQSFYDSFLGIFFLFLSLSKKKLHLEMMEEFLATHVRRTNTAHEFINSRNSSRISRENKKTDKVYTCFLKLFSKQWIPWITIHWNYVFFFVAPKESTFQQQQQQNRMLYEFWKGLFFFGWIPRIQNQTFGIPLGLIDWIDRKKK